MEFMAAVLVLVGVFAMRWNVVIGGQLISKSGRGFLSYTPPLGGREGVLAATVLLMLPFYILSVITNLLPPWERPPDEVGEAPEAVEPEPSTAAASSWETGSRRPSRCSRRTERISASLAGETRRTQHPGRCSRRRPGCGWTVTGST